MTTDAKKKTNRLQRLNPRTWIGYLIGYDSTNIYRIWNPVLNKVFRTRDVILNEDVVFDGKKENPEIRLDRLQSTIQEIEEPEAEGPPEEVLESDEPNFQVVIPALHGDLDEYELFEGEEHESNDELPVEDLEYEAEKAFENPDDFYPTPDATPPTALLAAAIRGSAEERINEPVSKFEPLKASLVPEPIFNSTSLVQKDSLANADTRRFLRTGILPESSRYFLNPTDSANFIDANHRRSLIVIKT